MKGEDRKENILIEDMPSDPGLWFTPLLLAPKFPIAQVLFTNQLIGFSWKEEDGISCSILSSNEIPDTMEFESFHSKWKVFTRNDDNPEFKISSSLTRNLKRV